LTTGVPEDQVIVSLSSGSISVVADIFLPAGSPSVASVEKAITGEEGDHFVAIVVASIRQVRGIEYSKTGTIGATGVQAQVGEKPYRSMRAAGGSRINVQTAGLAGLAVQNAAAGGMSFEKSNKSDEELDAKIDVMMKDAAVGLGSTSLAMVLAAMSSLLVGRIA